MDQRTVREEEGEEGEGWLTVLILARIGVPNYLKLVCLLGSN